MMGHHLQGSGTVVRHNGTASAGAAGDLEPAGKRGDRYKGATNANPTAARTSGPTRILRCRLRAGDRTWTRRQRRRPRRRDIERACSASTSSASSSRSASSISSRRMRPTMKRNALSLHPPDPLRVEWQPALRGRTLDVRAREDVGSVVRTPRRQRQSHLDRALRTAAQALPRHRLTTRRIHRRKMRPQQPVAAHLSTSTRSMSSRQNFRRREYTMTCSASISVFSTRRAVCAGLYGSSTKPPVTEWTTRTSRSPETRCA